TKVSKLEETAKGIKAVLEGAEVKEKEPVFDRVLTAVGRRPNSRDLGLDKAGVEADAKGFIKVDERRRTTAERIYAIGDVAGEPIAEAMLAIEMAATARDVALTMHAHPTLSETLLEASESLYGLAIHTLPRKQ